MTPPARWAGRGSRARGRGWPLGTRRTLLVALAAVTLACAEGRGKRRGIASRQPDEGRERGGDRPTGCIDTPFLDERRTSAGVQCGRRDRADVVVLRGRVQGLRPDGLPGAGLEGLWVSVHLVDVADGGRAGPALAEVQSGPQGEFSLTVEGAEGELLVAARAQRGGATLAARRLSRADLDALDEAGRELVLAVAP